MPAYQRSTPPVPSSWPVATAPYAADATGVPRPLVAPATCVANGASAAVCRIGVHHRRERKTGPCFPIMVCFCHAHRRGFTLYPLGHVPYGRVAVAPVTVGGEPVLAAAPEHPRRLGWGPTLFAAAVDAKAGRAWTREDAVHGVLWDTQLDHLDAAATLLGLSAEVTPRLGEAVAIRLAVPRLWHLEAARDYRRGVGYQAHGQAICAVLDRIPASPCIVDRLLACGAIVGMWGRVVRWDPTRSGPGSRVFSPQREAPS